MTTNRKRSSHPNQVTNLSPPRSSGAFNSRELLVGDIGPQVVGQMPITDGVRMISVDEFCRRYGIGRTLTYAEIKAGRLRSCKIGRRRVIRIDDAEAWSWANRQTAPTICASDPATNQERGR
jgi:excisionase family DNA binding protein